MCIAGLKLNLFIDSNQYVSELSHAAGARIVIHDQDELAFPDEEGINALPGISTSVGVRKVNDLSRQKTALAERTGFLIFIFTLICALRDLFPSLGCGNGYHVQPFINESIRASFVLIYERLTLESLVFPSVTVTNLHDQLCW